MAELIGERKVGNGSSGSMFITLPVSYVRAAGLGKGSVVELYQEGDTLTVKPKTGDGIRLQNK